MRLTMGEALFGKRKAKRKPFKTSTKKKEWNKSVGRSETDFKSTSKCRKCKRRLTWGTRTYEFDHKDNNSANNSQRNCYLVCRVCHGRATVIKKKKVRDRFTGMVTGHKTIKKKVGYKKSTRPKKKKSRRTKKPKSIFDINFRF